MHHLQVKPLGDSALLVVFGHTISIDIHDRVQAFLQLIEQQPFDGFIECVPAYTNVCIYYDPYFILQNHKNGFPFEIVKEYVTNLVQTLTVGKQENRRVIEIPVRYGGEEGPDLAEVAAFHHMTEQEVIRRHSESEVLVYMLGFAPGFAFMGGMDEAIATPRKAQPRMRIEAGSVGIAGKQTGVYPFETPGGWNIIGRTELPLFLPDQQPPTLLRAGDRVRFVPIVD